MRCRLPLTATLIVLSLALAACGSSPSSLPTSPSTPTAKRVPLPAGRDPSPIARMVCIPKTQHELSEVLGVKPVEVQTPTWVDHRYSCRYVYSNGSMTLSIKELSSWAQTLAYYRALGTELGNTSQLSGLGQGAFTTTNGSVVARKDWKVLDVDISGLPPQFGVPPTSRADIAVTVTDVIMGCWAGD